MREAIWIGVLTLGFGVAATRLQGEAGGFALTQIAIGSVALVYAAYRALRRIETRRPSPAATAALCESLLQVVAVVWAVFLLQGFLRTADWRFDWTFEQHATLAAATCKAALALPAPLRITLYEEVGDPRTRRTRQLLDEIGRCGPGLVIDQKDLDQNPGDGDRFGIPSSNSVVVQAGGRFETVTRPTEGALFEALSMLAPADHGRLYIAVGNGEGNASRSFDLGYSGFAAALETEGFELATLVTASITEIPHDAAAVITLAPERRYRPEALKALRRYLERGGGSLIAFLAPCRSSGVEEILGEFGLSSRDAMVIDPASGPVDGEAPGLNPLAHSYEVHPSTRGLNSNRMTFFRHSRSFELKKPRPDDRITPTVYASHRSWLYDDPCHVGGRVTPKKPADAKSEYHPLVVTGEYQRGGGETRIAAFGNVEIASNRDLRSIYNLDLVLNTVHWAVQREPSITLRPKTGGVLQFPVPLQNSMQAFYGIGLLVPEVILLVGGLVWMRRRSA
jgi:hypothetical protein